MATPRQPREQIMIASADGVALSIAHLPGDDTGDFAFIVVHGFAGSWRQARVGKVMDALASHGGVVAVDQRGHGRSAGRTTIGHREPLDVEAAVSWARQAGYARIVPVGFSMGGAVAIRHAALLGRAPKAARIDAVVSVSGPGFWHYRGTPPMRWLHRAVGHPLGRAYLRWGLGAYVDPTPWPQPPPMPPTEAAKTAVAAGLPVLIVHGDADPFFPLDHPHALHASAPGSELWIEPGFGHAEGAIDSALVHRIARWARQTVDST
ncbi:MAG: alpha/beta fold hydrolase [Candidatus Nanopelagicales bacterium]